MLLGESATLRPRGWFHARIFLAPTMAASPCASSHSRISAASTCSQRARPWHSSSTGLNVVYGKNGAGKTGYARIVKHAGRTLRRETVLANVAEPGSPRPSAKITVVIGEMVHPLPLDLESSPPSLLARICVADSLAGEEYLTSDTEVDYAPAALTSLNRLAKGLKAVGDELSKRLNDTQPHPLDLRPFGEGTAVSRVLASLSDSTSEDAIDKLSVLSDQERERLGQLRRKRGEIDASRRPNSARPPNAQPRARRSSLVSCVRSSPPSVPRG